MSKLKIKTVRMMDGERLPLLLNKDTGLPLDLPNLYITTDLRTGGRSSKTLETALTGIRRLLQCLDYMNIDLEARLQAGEFICLDEVEGLLNLMGLHQDEFDRRVQEEREQGNALRGVERNINASPLPKIVSLEDVRVRLRSRKAAKQIKPGTLAVNLFYALAYLRWLGARYLDRYPTSKPDAYLVFQAKVERCLQKIEVYMPPKSLIETAIDERLGLEEHLRQRLKEVINPNSLENPWNNSFVRLRNELLIHMALGLGDRRGELLIKKLSDINIAAKTIIIHRRPNDKEDPRTVKPNTKTLPRKLAMSEKLTEMCAKYIEARKKLPHAKRTPFLFLNKQGDPLSLASVNLIFRQLRQKFPDFPANFTPHLLRYTWNDIFSEQVDAKGTMSEDVEKQTRAHQMGWSKKGTQVERYAKRTIARKAQEASLAVQEATLGSAAPAKTNEKADT